MICENCGTVHEGQYGSGRFCCKKCACAYSTKNKRQEINTKVSQKMSGRTGWSKGKKIEWSEERLEKFRSSFDDEKRKSAAGKHKQKAEEKYLNTLFDDLGLIQKRRRVIEEQDFRCNRCGMKEWLGQPITLEYEHKDGNKKNNNRNNVEALCPNCHSLTPTWRKKKSSLVNACLV